MPDSTQGATPQTQGATPPAGPPTATSQPEAGTARNGQGDAPITQGAMPAGNPPAASGRLEAGTASMPQAAQRLAVRKTYKLFVGGKFPRSESGRTYLVQNSNVALASRKDARDAVVAARSALKGWSGATAYNRGQVLYRAAEMLEGRRAEFVGLGVPASEVDAAVDRWVWYAGWADKIAQVYGAANPVAGPYLNVSVPEPTGVVAVVAPTGSALLGLVSVIAPAIVTGNTVVVLAAEESPLPAVTLAEVLATSDVPGGVVNILTGRPADTAPWLAAHLDVNAIDLAGVVDPELAASLEEAAAGNLKRVLRPSPEPVDWAADPGTRRMTDLVETKTVWHPRGA